MIDAPTKPAAETEAARPARAASIERMAWYWFPALAWMAMVFLASTDPFSAKTTGYILGVVLTWMFGHINAPTFALIHFLVRKSAHFTEYAILSALWFRALRVGLPTLWQIRWALVGLVISLLVAIADEVHQSFVPSRTASAHDVLLDLCGALFAQIVIWYVLRRQTAVAEL